MLFVFGAMVEFTVVLIAKQIAESQAMCPKTISLDAEMKNGGSGRKLGILSGRKRSSRIQNYDSESKKKKNYGKYNDCNLPTRFYKNFSSYPRGSQSHIEASLPGSWSGLRSIPGLTWEMGGILGPVLS